MHNRHVRCNGYPLPWRCRSHVQRCSRSDDEWTAQHHSDNHQYEPRWYIPRPFSISDVGHIPPDDAASLPQLYGKLCNPYRSARFPHRNPYGLQGDPSSISPFIHSVTQSFRSWNLWTMKPSNRTIRKKPSSRYLYCHLFSIFTWIWILNLLKFRFTFKFSYLLRK